MQYVASRPAIALYYIDSEVKTEWGDRFSQAGTAVIVFLDENLFSYIPVAVLAANQSLNSDRYFFTFGRGNGHYDDVLAILSRLTDKRVYSTGSSTCSPVTYDHALEIAVAGKHRGENGLTIVWTIDKQSSLHCGCAVAR